MAKDHRPGFIIHLTPTADCTDPIKALRELLKRALRSWGLKCVHASEIREGDRNER